MTYWWGFGEPRPALELLEHAIEPYERGAENTWIAWAEINLAAVYGQLGRRAAARRLLASPLYSEKEAARVLDSYYFERGGSHERVAELPHDAADLLSPASRRASPTDRAAAAAGGGGGEPDLKAWRGNANA